MKRRAPRERWGLFVTRPSGQCKEEVSDRAYLDIFGCVTHLHQEQYSQDRLIAAVRERLRVPPGDLFSEVLQDVRQFGTAETFPDDICLVGMEVAELN